MVNTFALRTGAAAGLWIVGGCISCVVALYFWKKNERKKLLSKERVLQKRSDFFSKSMSVSYANTDPLMILKGRGARLIDEQGIAYLDTRNNVAHCGHCHPTVVRSVQRQVATLNTNTRYLHPNICLLAERLIAKLPESLDTVFFVNSGSEANDLALRLAKAWSGGSLNTIVVQGAYHGHTMATLDLSPYKYETSKEYSSHKGSELGSPGEHIYQVQCPDIYRGQYRDLTTAGTLYAAQVTEACRHFQQQNPEKKVRAYIIEAGMSIGGVILPPPGYLEACAAAVRQAGGLYIADEVQTGLGRLGSCFWAFQYQHPGFEGSTVIPDIVTVGKPFGNGMPLAAVITSRKVAAVFEDCGVEYFNTFGGNPVSAAAGLAVLDVIEKERLQERALDVGTYLKEKLVELMGMVEWIGDVRGSGLFLGIEIVRSRTTKEPAADLTSWVCSTLKTKYQILSSIDGLFNNVLVVKPPMVFSRSDADLFVSCVEQVLTNDFAMAGNLQSITKTPT